VAELADAVALEATFERSAGSSPVEATIFSSSEKQFYGLVAELADAGCSKHPS